MSFSSAIYADYNGIFLFFCKCPNVIVLKYFISTKAQIYERCNYSVPRSINPAVVLTYAANATLDRLRDLQSRITRDYSKKPSSLVTTRCDEENQVFLTTHCDRLRSPFISPRSLSINGSSDIAPGETIQNRHFVLRNKVTNTP